MQVFKYKSTHNTDDFNRDLECLKKDEVWFSTLQSLNDPYENILCYDIMSYDDHGLYLDNVRDELEKIKDNIGIFSLSRNRSNLVMWSHYANNHKGYCVEFDLTPEKFIKGENYDLIQSDVDYDAPLNTAYNRNNIKSFFSHKYTDWKYEEEVRFISDKSGLHKFKEGSIKAIYLGANCNEIVKTCISEFCKSKSIKLHQGKLLNDSLHILNFSEIQL
jgi:hypothetical protein